MFSQVVCAGRTRHIHEISAKIQKQFFLWLDIVIVIIIASLYICSTPLKNIHIIEKLEFHSVHATSPEFQTPKHTKLFHIDQKFWIEFIFDLDTALYVNRSKK